MEDEPFLNAIREDPGDEARRLVYADWLDDRSDPRAEFLRVEHELWRLPFDAPRRRELGARWRELRQSLDAEWLRRIDCERPISPGCLAACRGEQGGVFDYYAWMRNNHWEWVMLAALAPIECVVPAVIESRVKVGPDAYAADGHWLRDVPMTGPGREGDAVAPFIPFVQRRGSPWTVATYCTFNLTMPSYTSAQFDARMLSERFGTLAAEFSSEDTSGATGYRMYECGTAMEFAEWSGWLDSFASHRREPPWEQFPREYPEELFRMCGLYVPSFYAMIRAGVPSVVIDAGPPSAVRRADLVDLWPHFRDEGLNIPNEFPEVHRLVDEHDIDGGGGDGDIDLEDDHPIPF